MAIETRQGSITINGITQYAYETDNKGSHWPHSTTVFYYNGYSGGGRYETSNPPAQRRLFFYRYYVDTSTGNLTSNPFLVGQYANTGIWWVKSDMFPVGQNTVAFNLNGGSGTFSNKTLTWNTTLALDGTAPTRQGYSFDGWKSSKSDTIYAADATLPTSEYSVYGWNATAPTLTLTAQWTLVEWPVTYDSNGGTGTIAAQTKVYNTNLTLESSGFTRTNYTLTGWNTAADGSGTPYSLGGTYTVNAALALYAQWTPVPKTTITYNANALDATGSIASQTVYKNGSVTIKSNTFIRDNHRFVKWNTAAAGGGTDYQPGDTYTANINSDTSLILYAQWQILDNTVTYDINTPTVQGGTAPTTPQSQTKYAGTSLTLASAPDGTSWEPPYTFVRWTTSANGTGNQYEAGGTYDTQADVTLYAQWTDGYTAPSFSDVQIYRSDSLGNADDEGTCIAATGKVTVHDVNGYASNGINALTLKYKTASASVWLTVSITPDSPTTITGGKEYTFSGITASIISTDAAYNAKVEVVDSYSHDYKNDAATTQGPVKIPTTFFTMDFGADGKSAALGGAASSSLTGTDSTNGRLDVYMNSYFGGEVSAPFASSPQLNGNADKTNGILYGQVDATSTSTVFTASVSGLTSLYDGACVLLKNGVVTSAANFTINVNGLGAKPVYSNMAAATRESTIFNINYTLLFVYDSTRVSGGCWINYRGYYSDSNSIGYQLRTNSGTLPAADDFVRYRLLFTSADGTKWVPATTSTSTNATSTRAVNQRAINPFGPIVYYSTTTAVAADTLPSVSTTWEQYSLTLGYSFNRTGAALSLTYPAPVYIKAAPQADGSAIIDDTTPYVQALPSTNDGKIYIFLGIAYSETNVELRVEHPIYYHDGTAIKLWTGPEAAIDIATTSTPGIVKPDGTTITVDSNGEISTAITLTKNSGGLTWAQTQAVPGSSPSSGWREEKWSDGRLTVWAWDWYNMNQSERDIPSNNPWYFPADATQFVELPTWSIGVRASANGTATYNIKTFDLSTRKITFYITKVGANGAYPFCIRFDGRWK